jgi:hypothetical protein
LADLATESADVRVFSEEPVDIVQIFLEDILDFTLKNDIPLYRVLLLVKFEVFRTDFSGFSPLNFAFNFGFFPCNFV